MKLRALFQRQSAKPWAEWPSCTHRPLVYDIERGTLDGVSLDASVEALQQFGRPSNDKPKKYESLVFGSLGLEVFPVRQSAILVFTCIFSGAADTDACNYSDFEPCELIVRQRNREIRLSGDSDRAAIESFTGPLTEEALADGVLLSATLGTTWLGFAFDSTGLLVLLDLEPA
jgi:hypothetical protein